jgi:hypothetical protein
MRDADLTKEWVYTALAFLLAALLIGSVVLLTLNALRVAGAVAGAALKAIGI